MMIAEYKEELADLLRGVVRSELAAQNTSHVPPDFAGYAYFKMRFGISYPTLQKLADNGHVRRKKVGESKQAQALYKVSDVEEWMHSDAGVE